MITYEALRDFVTREKASPKLIELPEGFLGEVRTYLETKEKASKGKEDVWELDNSRRMLQDLLDARESKIVKLALVFVRAGVTPGKLVPEEKEFFDGVVDCIRRFQESRKEAIEGKNEAMDTISATEEIPRFVGIDLKEYGPLKKGEIARVPKDNAGLLVSKGMARIMKGK